MDFFAHGLWTSVVYWKERRRDWLWAIFFGVMPDFVAFGPFFIEEFREHATLFRHHEVSLIPTYVYMMYNLGHSLVVFGLVFTLVWWLRGRRVWWPLGGWALHVLLDIPTHSIEFFGTPFLFPFASYRFDGIPWSHPWFLTINWVALVIVYSTLVVRKHQQRRVVTK
ncbi:hypothetical protein HY629_01345 [Candidatus Uhrbacteria bacterium]|nr:hypothetical protein [Candidatus Uhrbacteria bacterium]